jgi:hypothetical protein
LITWLLLAVAVAVQTLAVAAELVAIEPLQVFQFQEA